MPAVATTISRPCYATRESVADALDIRLTARMNRQIDQAIEAATVDVDDDVCLRTFTPWQGVKLFDAPIRDGSSWRLWLNQHELIRLDAATAGGQTLNINDLLFYPTSGPPYRRLETNLATSAIFTVGTTRQQTITLTGLWGYQDVQAAAGQLTANLAADDTVIAISDATAAGIGDLLQVENERLLVVGRRQADTGQTLGADLAAQANATTIPVADGDSFAPGETIAVDGERLRIDDITGNLLVVRRAWDGSTLAAHTTGTAIYAGRLLQVVRAAAGTTAASHTQGSTISRHVLPGLVSRYTRAAAEVTVLQDQAGWARTVGTGDNQRQASGAGLKQLRDQLQDAYARIKAR